ncbi:inner membrane protein YjcH [mine drainage metagenome]|uniref:Inner membrane protein YjcH n=1 Tax=mine drainage metagenome TaxID=410659 RepID=A0A1J5THB2_9ZZZZ
MSELIASKIQSNPKYLQLVRQRDTLAWTLSALVCVMYFGFTLMIAFAPDVLTQPIAADSVIPLGMLMGVGVILASCVLTGVYVYKANQTFDPIVSEIVREASK